MGLLNRFVKKARKKIFEGFYSRQIWIPPKLTTEEYLKEYGQIGWLYASVSKISQNVADTEWKAYTKDGKPVENSMALQRLLTPNPFYSLYEILELTSMYLDLTGKAFWYLAKDRLGRVSEIWVISPTYMYIVPDFQKHIKNYVYRDGVNDVPLDPNEVIFFNYPDPTNPYNGNSPAKAVASALESDKYASSWNRNFFYNSAEPQGVIEVPTGLTEEEYDRLKESWNDKYGGVDNAKKTAILESGATYKSIQISQKDMDFINLRNMNRDEILGVFGIPKSILGLTTDVNRANAETSEYTFAKHTVTPRLKRIQEKINNEYVSLFQEELLLKYTDIIPENKDFIAQTIKDNVDKVITKNEARQVVGKLLNIDLSPIENGDVIYQNTALQPLGTLPTSPNPMQVPTQPKGIEAVNDLIKIIEENKIIRNKKKVKVYFKSLDNNQYKTKFNKIIEQQVDEKYPIIQEIFDHQLDKLVANIKNGQGKKFTDFLRSKEEKTYMRGKIQPIITDAYVEGIKMADYHLNKAINGSVIKDADNINVDYSFNLQNPLVTEWILDNTLSNIDYINEYTEQELQKKLSQWEQEGLSIPNIAENLKQFFESFSENRRKTIARTEVVSSTNAGALHGYKKSGVVDNKKWMASLGPRTRPAHAEASGQIVSIDDDFTVDGESMRFPGDPNGSAGNVINCRCCIIPDFDNEE